MKRWKEIAFAAAFILLAAALLGLAGRALRPVRVDYGAVWAPYLAEPENSLDYLYLGSSYAYCDVNPGVIYGATGLTGHVLAGPEQTLSTTYYYLRQALKTQSPSLVVLEASALHFDRYQAYTQVNVGYMPFSREKLAAIFQAAEPELRTGLLFDLYFYHGRWKDTTLSEVLGAFQPVGTDKLKGFTAAEGVFEGIASGPFHRGERETYQENLAWLGKIAALCAERELPLAVVFHPTYSRLSDETYVQIRTDVKSLGVQYYNWSGVVEEIGLVPTLHFYDPGHLNRAGAEIFSTHLAGFLAQDLGLAPRVQAEENAAAWRETAAWWAQYQPPPAA